STSSSAPATNINLTYATPTTTIFFIHPPNPHQALHSFPTRRSSDLFTRLGGNQYINSASVGAWEDFLLHEMLPAIEQRYGESPRSEEHTSELQSLAYLVCRLLLEKKKERRAPGDDLHAARDRDQQAG